MGILDNEGHDPNGLGNILGRTDAQDMADLRAEIARLTLRVEHAEREKDKARFERDDIASRFKRECDLTVDLRAENEKLRAALASIDSLAVSHARGAAGQMQRVARNALNETVTVEP